MTSSGRNFSMFKMHCIFSYQLTFREHNISFIPIYLHFSQVIFLFSLSCSRRLLRSWFCKTKQILGVAYRIGALPIQHNTICTLYRNSSLTIFFHFLSQYASIQLSMLWYGAIHTSIQLSMPQYRLGCHATGWYGACTNSKLSYILYRAVKGSAARR